MKRRPLNPKHLTKIANASTFSDEREPPFRIGDIVQLNSGGPKMAVVDFEDGHVIVAWRNDEGSAEELSLPRGCLHRISPLE